MARRFSGPSQKPLRVSRTGFHIVLVTDTFRWQAQTEEGCKNEKLADELEDYAKQIRRMLEP